MARVPCALAMPPPRNSSSMSTVRSPTQYFRPVCTACLRSRGRRRSGALSLITSKPSGASRTREFGRCRASTALLACSFWLVDNLILQRRVREARAMFERLLAFRNDVGLLAEEYDPRTRRQMGNFPQAFSHVALVNTAYNFTRSEGPAEVRAGREAANVLSQTFETSVGANMIH